MILSERVDGFTDRRWTRFPADPEARRHRALSGARPRRSTGVDEAAAAAPTCSAAASCIRCPPHRCSAFRRGSRRSSAQPAVFVARQAANGAPSCSCRRSAMAATNRSARSSTRRFGREAVTYLAEPLLAGIHAGDVDRLSIGALFPRFVEIGAEARQPAARVPSRGGLRRQSPDGAFKSLPGGLSELVAALVAALPAGSIRLRAPVARVTAGAGSGRFRVETRTGAGRRATRRARDAGVRDRDDRERPRCRARPRAVRRDSVCVDRDRGARVRARRRGASAERIGLRRAARGALADSRRDRGCRRSGRTARPTDACCCARSSAARAIRARSQRSDEELVARVADGADAARSASAAIRCSRASTAGRARTRSTKSVISIAWPTSTARSRAILVCSSPAAASAASAFPTASPTAAPPRERLRRGWQRTRRHPRPRVYARGRGPSELGVGPQRAES